MFVSHLRNMFLYFLAATLLVFTTGVGLTLGSSWLLIALAAAVIPAITLGVGIGSTMQLRGLLSLMQTGRLIQWAAFFIGALLSLHIASLIGAVTLTSHWLSALVLFATAFGAATVFGEVPWRGRTWLPVRRK
jgi:hypothetical protein